MGLMNFEDDVLTPIRAHLGRNIQVPSGAEWRVEQRPDGVSLHLDIDARALSQNFQTDLAAAPSFLICLSYWLERATGSRVSASVHVSGEAPSEGTRKLHWNRATFLLDQFQAVLSERLTFHPPGAWRWPRSPMLNSATDERTVEATIDARPEHVLETFLCRNNAAKDELAALIGPIGPLARQLPLGLFEGRVAAACRWTPGGNSQIDLWAPSADGRTVHLFELKADGNMHVGILPEAFCYSRLMHHVRVGLVDGTKVAGDSAALDAVRAAERIKMWLVVPSVHPLLLTRNASPLEWLNAGMRQDGVEIGILPIAIKDGVVGRWLTDERWPPTVSQRLP